MNLDEGRKYNHRDFLKKTGAASLGAATLAAASVVNAGPGREDDVISEYWKKKQRKYEALAQLRAFLQFQVLNMAILR